MPNLALIAETTATASYIGSHKGPERELVKRAGVPFYSVQTGKLRRYFDWRNFTDPFRVILGFFQAWRILGKLRPDVLFSKGGFVAVPVVWAAWLRRIPVVIHESDASEGLATKLTAPFARKVLLAFPGEGKKRKVVGNPVRSEILKGKKAAGLKFTALSGKKPRLLVMGGSAGAQQVNELITQNKEELLKHYELIHLFGKGKGRSIKKANHFSAPYVFDEMKDVYAATDLVISRAGANSLAELQALGLPALLIPLGAESSRGDQWENAEILCKNSKSYAIWNPKKALVEQLRGLTKSKKEGKIPSLDLILKEIKNATKS